jgi:hypothetical protein
MINFRDENSLHNKILMSIAEYGIYIFCLFAFFGKGESFRSIGLYAPLVVIFIRAILSRQAPFNWKDPLFLVLISFCLSAILSSIFSENSVNSIVEFKRTYFKALLIFIVIASVF